MCHHIGLFSQDPESLVTFYTEKLGFEHKGSKIISADWMDKIFGFPVASRLIKLGFGSAVIEIFAPQSGELVRRTAGSSGYNHWGLGVEDKESYVILLEKMGVPLLKLEGSGKSIYFIKDPEGNLIEIYEK